MRQRILNGAGFAALQTRVLCEETDRSLAKTALGNNQATAFKLIASWTQFTTVAAGTGAIVDGTSDIGDEFHVTNFGANALALYPHVGGKINNGGANASINIAANATVKIKRLDLTNWVTL